MLNAALALLLAVAVVARWGVPVLGEKLGLAVGCLAGLSLAFALWVVAADRVGPGRPGPRPITPPTPQESIQRVDMGPVVALARELNQFRTDVNTDLQDIKNKLPTQMPVPAQTLPPPVAGAAPAPAPAPVKMRTLAAVVTSKGVSTLQLSLQSDPPTAKINSGNVKFCPSDFSPSVTDASVCREGFPNTGCSQDYICRAEPAITVEAANHYKFVTIPPDWRNRSSTILVEIVTDGHPLTCIFHAALGTPVGGRRPPAPVLELSSETAVCTAAGEQGSGRTG